MVAHPPVLFSCWFHPESLSSLPLLLQLWLSLPFLPIFFKIFIILLWQVWSCSMGSLLFVATHRILSWAYRNKSTVQRLNLWSLHWKLSVLDTGPPGNVLPASLPLFSSCLFLAPSFTSYSKSFPPNFLPDLVLRWLNIWSKWWMGPKKWAVDWRHSFSTNFQNKNYNGFARQT